MIVFNSNRTAVLILSIAIAVATSISGFSNITVASRLAYSMSRDGAIPYSSYFSKIDEST
jgi:amino acid transporter